MDKRDGNGCAEVISPIPPPPLYVLSEHGRGRPQLRKSATSDDLRMFFAINFRVRVEHGLTLNGRNNCIFALTRV